MSHLDSVYNLHTSSIFFGLGSWSFCPLINMAQATLPWVLHPLLLATPNTPHIPLIQQLICFLTVKARWVLSRIRWKDLIPHERVFSSQWCHAEFYLSDLSATVCLSQSRAPHILILKIRFVVGAIWILSCLGWSLPGIVFIFPRDLSEEKKKKKKCPVKFCSKEIIAQGASATLDFDFTIIYWLGGLCMMAMWLRLRLSNSSCSSF